MGLKRECKMKWFGEKRKWHRVAILCIFRNYFYLARLDFVGFAGFVKIKKGIKCERQGKCEVIRQACTASRQKTLVRRSEKNV